MFYCKLIKHCYVDDRGGCIIKSIEVYFKRMNNACLSYDNGYQIGSMIYNITEDMSSSLIMHDNQGYTDHVISWALPISQDKKFKSKGIDTDEFKIIIRSYNKKKINSFKKIFNHRKVFSIGKVKCKVKRLREVPTPTLSGPVQFKTVSPVLIKDEKNNPVPADKDKEKYVDELESSIIENYSKYCGSAVDGFVIRVGSSFKRKALKVSSATKHRCYSFHGFIEGDRKVKEFAYYCGLGNNTHFGLGCWEVL